MVNTLAGNVRTRRESVDRGFEQRKGDGNMRKEACLKCGSSRDVVRIEHWFYVYGCKKCGIGWRGITKKSCKALQKNLTNARDEVYYSYTNRCDMPSRRDAIAAIDKFFDGIKVDVSALEKKHSDSDLEVMF